MFNLDQVISTLFVRIHFLPERSFASVSSSKSLDVSGMLRLIAMICYPRRETRALG